MIRLFEIENKIVIPTEHCFVVGYLKDIMKDYPDDFLQVYQFLFYMKCPGPDNPYFNMPDVDVEDTIIHDLGGLNFNAENDDIIEALKKTERLYETPTVRAHKGIKTAMDNIADYLNNTTITDGKEGNIGQVRSMAKDFDMIRKSYKGTAKDIEDEQKALHVRGDQNLAYDQE
jgi:hypothetical protein